MADDVKRGRPRIADADRAVAVSVRVPPKQYDAICQQARRDTVSLSAVIRQAIQKKIAVE